MTAQLRRDPPPIITLTTDFGQRDGYVAAMQGVILSLCPAVTIVQLSHDIPPQDIQTAA
ncbi:MAG: SAM-dependent chlorinase/fluorinase, partial [Chloroflexota bacterium]